MATRNGETRMTGTALIFDTETTGLMDFSQPADAEGQPRLLSVAGSLVNNVGDVTESFYLMVKPEGFEIDEEGEAFKVNGLSNFKLNDFGLPIVDVLTRYDEFVDKCDFVSAFGLGFDQKMIRAEQRRAGRDDRYGYRDTFELMYKARKVACEKGGPHSNPKKLGECYENIMGKPLEGAHSANKDVEATVEIYRKLLLAGLVEPKPQVSKQ